MKRYIKTLLTAGGTALLAAGFFYRQNNALQTSFHTHLSSRLPKGFDGFRAVHLSDLHNKSFGADNGALLEKIEKCAPDIIVASGDMIDSKYTDIGCASSFFESLKNIAPVYYAPGNHEARLGDDYAAFAAHLRKTGINLLENELVEYERNGQSIFIAGVASPRSFSSGEAFDTAVFRLCHSVGEGYCLLIAHHPEKMSVYNLAGADFIFSGHAHGGQVRIPFTDIGLFAPSQNFFPKYTSGIHTAGKTSMSISRGLSGTLPLRLFNRPELVVIDFECEKYSQST